MSLANRITLFLLGLLAALGVGAGGLLSTSARQTLEAQLDGLVDQRLAWIVSSLEVDQDEIEFEPQRELDVGAQRWQIAAGPRILWGEELPEDWDPVGYRSAEAPLVGGVSGSPVVAAQDYRQASADGSGDQDSLGYAKYQIPDARRTVELRARAWISTAGMEAELARLRRLLWSVGLPALCVIGLLLSLAIRWQLRPLAVMARQASGIGPDSLQSRIGAVGSTRECTALRVAINGMLERLAEGLERERKFASVAAHELRTPVAQLRTHVEVTLRRDRPEGEYRAALQETLTDIDRLQRLMTGLLQLTRNQVRDGDPEWTPLEAALRGAAARSGTDLVVPGEASEVAVHGDAELLTAALANVLENALRHAPEAPPEVEVVANPGIVSVAIRDRGPGVPEQDRERIFDPLVRLDAARTVGETADGFGLGLAVARTIARRFDGDLTCSAPADSGPGAVFTFRLLTVALGRHAGHADSV